MLHQHISISKLSIWKLKVAICKALATCLNRVCMTMYVYCACTHGQCLHLPFANSICANLTDCDPYLIDDTDCDAKQLERLDAAAIAHDWTLNGTAWTAFWAALKAAISHDNKEVNRLPQATAPAAINIGTVCNSKGHDNFHDCNEKDTSYSLFTTDTWQLNFHEAWAHVLATWGIIHIVNKNKLTSHAQNLWILWLVLNEKLCQLLPKICFGWIPNCTNATTTISMPLQKI